MSVEDVLWATVICFSSRAHFNYSEFFRKRVRALLCCPVMIPAAPLPASALLGLVWLPSVSIAQLLSCRFVSFWDRLLGNLGDSRAVIAFEGPGRGRSVIAEDLSEDHQPGISSERSRIEAAGYRLYK